MAKIEIALKTEWLAQCHDRRHVCIFHLLRLIARQESHGLGQAQHLSTVLSNSRSNYVTIIVDEYVGVETSGAKVEQHQLSAILVE